MHLSTHNWMRAEPLETTLKRIKKFGYESIEISGEPEQYKTKETRASLKEHGIRCWGSVTLMLGERNLAAKDQGQRERSVQYVKDVLTMVSELDGEIITTRDLPLLSFSRRLDPPARHAHGRRGGG